MSLKWRGEGGGGKGEERGGKGERGGEKKAEGEQRGRGGRGRDRRRISSCAENMTTKKLAKDMINRA